MNVLQRSQHYFPHRNLHLADLSGFGHVASCRLHLFFLSIDWDIEVFTKKHVKATRYKRGMPPVYTSVMVSVNHVQANAGVLGQAITVTAQSLVEYRY